MSKSLLRALYKRVHPDLFEAHPAAQRVNEASFKQLQALLHQHDAYSSHTTANLHFFVADANSKDAATTELKHGAEKLRSVEGRVRTGSLLVRDLNQLVAALGGDVPTQSQTQDVPKAGNGSTHLWETATSETRFTQVPWWRPRPQKSQFKRSSKITLEKVLAENSDRAREMSAAADAAEEEMLQELQAVLVETGLRVRFADRLRCQRTRRRLWHTLRSQLFPENEPPSDLRGCTIKFTDTDPSQAQWSNQQARVFLRDHSHYELATADEDFASTLWLSCQDTAFGWRQSMLQHSERASSDAALPDAASSDACRRVAEAVEAERAACVSLWVGGVRSESAELRRSDEYAPFLHGVRTLRPRLREQWGASAADSWHVVVTRATWSAMRAPLLQPQLLQVQLPLGSELRAIESLLNGPGRHAADAHARSRLMVERSRAALRLRALTVDETLSPEQARPHDAHTTPKDGSLARVGQVLHACEKMESQAGTVRSSSEGIRVHLSFAGFRLLEDGTLSIGWDSL